MNLRRAGKRILKVSAAIFVAALALLFLYGATKANLKKPPPTLLLLDKYGAYIGEVNCSHSAPLGYWRLTHVPPRVAAACLAAEDRRFWSHPGVSPRAVLRALLQNYRSGRHVSGASTLAMQIARLQTPGARTYLRKSAEAMTAFLLTLRYGRRAVLSHYLQIAPFGNRIRGIAYAAQRYFDKPAKDLTWAEAALLMAIPQSPGRMNLYSSKGRSLACQRGRRILYSLFKEGYIKAAEHELAQRHIGRLFPLERPKTPLAALHVLQRYQNMLITERTKLKSPIVQTTISLAAQKKAQKTLRSYVDRWQGLGVTNGAVMVIARDGSVLLSVGSKDYFHKESAGAIDYTNVSRSPGSMLKPFVYALALERGLITPGTILDDLRRARGGIRNADYRFLGPLLPRQALANSRNVPAANLLEKLGVERLFDLTAVLGLHKGQTPSSKFGTGLVIGTLPVTLTNLICAYRALADEGVHRSLKWYKGQKTGRNTSVFSQSTGRHIALFLSDPMARLPTFKRMGYLEYPYAAAVKTGTSSRCRDAWCICWTRRYMGAVWLGRPDYRPMNGVTGYRSAGRLLKSIMMGLPDNCDELEDRNFPPPKNHVPVKLCSSTGQKRSKHCSKYFIEWFPQENQPTRVCSAHKVVHLNGKERTVLTLAPRYAAWAQTVGMTSALPNKAPQRGLLRHDFEIVAPENGQRLLKCPETPAAKSTIALEAVVTPSPSQLVWYVDGQPFKVVDYPFTTRWQMERGRHFFQVGLPGVEQKSSPIYVSVE